VKLTNVILAGLLILPGVSKAQETVAESKFVTPGLAPGDMISVHMYDFPDNGISNLSIHVAADGSVHLPYAGTIQVSGKSPAETEQAISEALRSKGIVKEPNVTVDVVSAVNLAVSVLGQVLSPKSIPLYAPAPLSFVLTQVGGLSGLAAHHLTILHHNEQLPTSVDFDPEAPTGAAMNTLVQPGDVVTVTSAGVYFVAGEVNRPGIFPIGGGISVGQASATSGTGMVKHITLLEALAQAGGITPIAARSKMLILRTVDGKRQQIQVDEVKLYKGEVADPILHPDDIIYVPSSYLRQQTNNLFSTALSGVYAAVQLREFNQ
jgi:polysaccharide export outer membrane protein